jgi:hypothetical protein
VSADDLRRAYAAGVRRATGIVAVALQTITLVPLLVSLPRMRLPVFAILLWVTASAGIAVTIRVVRRRSLSRVECAALVAFGVAVMVADAANTATVTVGAGAAGDQLYVDWTGLTLPLLVMLVAVSRPVEEWLLAFAAATAALVAFVLTQAGTEPLAVSQLAGTIYWQCALLTFATMVGPVLRRTAERTAQAVQAEAELAAMQDTEILVRQDRARGLQAIEREVLPLLAAIGEGLLDPRDPTVRDRCARHGGAVRRTLAAGQSAALGDLAPALVDAEERGVHLDVQVCGDLRRAPAQVRAELATHMAGALATVPNEGVMLTLYCDATGGRLFLTYPGDAAATSSAASAASGGGGERTAQVFPPRPANRAEHPARPLVAVSTDRGDGRVCMELRWDGYRHPL